MCLCLDQIDEATPEDKAWWRPPYRKRSVLITCAILCGVLMVPSILVPAFAEYFPGTLITAFVLKAMLDLWRDRKAEQTAPAETQNPLAPATTEEPLLDRPAAPKPRLYFLDNIKTLLTAIVITHHTTGAYAGTGWTYGIGDYANSFASFGRAVMTLDQAYFMCLFFFISAYFTPASVARKGRRGFLKDRCRRLALPTLVYLWGLGPLADWTACKAKRPSLKCSYGPDPGPTWFLLWLLLFSTVYASIEDDAEPQSYARPGWGRLFGVSALLTPVQLGLMLACGGYFLFMPMTFGSLPYDVAFWCAGCVAKRNAWLENLEATYGPTERTVVVALVLCLCCFAFTFIAPLYVDRARALIPGPGDDAFDDGDDDADDADSPSLDLAVYAGLAVFCGVYVVVMPVAWLQAGAKWLDRPTWRGANRAAFAAYIIHPVFLNAFVYAWLVVLRTRFDDDPMWHTGAADSSTILSSSLLLWGGWAFTVAATQLAVWPTAYFLTTLKSMKGILV